MSFRSPGAWSKGIWIPSSLPPNSAVKCNSGILILNGVVFVLLAKNGLRAEAAFMSSPQPLSPIDGVISELRQLISGDLAQRSRTGYFASLYLRVTNTIRSKIGTGFFDDDARLERLDATFASRYLTAVRQFRSNDPALPKAWATALTAASDTGLIILQHLLLSMNPHINIDLAIAAAQTSPGNSIGSLHNDFNKVNGILASVVPAVISEIGQLSPYLHLVSDLAQDGETSIIDFSLEAARDASWAMAEKLAQLSPAEQEGIVTDENIPIAALGQRIVSPDFIVAEVFRIIRSAEVQDVDQIINALNAGASRSLLPAAPSAAVSAVASVPPPATAASARTTVSADRKPSNEVYYFEVAPGSWSGTFSFQVTSWRNLWSSSMSLKNKLLASAMSVWQKIFGQPTISSQLTPHPDPNGFGTAINTIRIHKSWFTLWHSDELYTLHSNGHRVSVDARVYFGPISFLFREHDRYPATVIDGGMRNLYHIKLLGARFLGDYHVQPDRRQVLSTLSNSWAIAHEVLNKSTIPAPGNNREAFRSISK
jgi:hypothetical protein